jgi:hypothetical protein
MARVQTTSATVALVFQKEGQVHALWAVYTAVQFALGGFGLSTYSSEAPMPFVMGVAVLAGVWAFNLGHLSMILKCIAQIEKLCASDSVSGPLSHDQRLDLRRIATGREPPSADRPDRVRNVFGRGYGVAIGVHLFIDVCASVALLGRVSAPGWAWWGG